jgi:hypothetical protein
MNKMKTNSYLQSLSKFVVIVVAKIDRGILRQALLQNIGEVTHYEVPSAMAKLAKDRKFSTKVRAILKDEKKHLRLCTRLAKQISI